MPTLHGIRDNQEEEKKMAHEDLIKEHQARTAKALAMGGEAKLKRRADAGLLNARQRIDLLFDEGTFTESGRFAVSYRPEDRDSTPADGKITGWGKIEGRDTGVVANDFTVKGASSSRINGVKIGHMKRVATLNGMPMVFLGESSGARMPDSMGAQGMGSSGMDPTQYMRKRETPWASAVLGDCYGSSVWYATLSDYVVMRKGAILAVSSPRVTSMAIGEEVNPEELGGWKLQSEVTGQVDLAVDTDEEAIQAIRRFLSYLPSHNRELPPRQPVPPGSDEPCEKILDLVPESRTRVYDMNKIIQAIVDRDSFFPIKHRFGKAAVTALTRLDGHTVGFLASNPLHKAGAMDPDACDKMTNFLVMCDSYNIPVVILVDTPGFLIGIDGERKKAPGKIMNFMMALQLCTVPRISIIMRKTYGQAYLNMGGGRNSDEVAAWFTAEVSFMDPDIGTYVVHGIQEKDDPERYKTLRAEMARDTSPYDVAAIHGVQTVIDPRETRAYLIRALEIHRRRRENGLGEHQMSTWPFCQ